MYTNEQDHYQFPQSAGNAYDIDSVYGLMPPDFSLTTSSPPTKQDALKRHAQNFTFVESSLQELESSTDDVEKNSADWVREKAIKLFVGTQTHDTEVRGKAMLNDPDDRAYFGAKKEIDVFPSLTADYDEHNLPDWDNCRSANKSTLGAANDDYITLFDPLANKISKSYLKNTIVHEVQHHADHHNDEKQGNAADNVNDAWICYKTEFRGYWVEGSYDHYSEIPKSKFGMSPKQNAIYTQIYSEYDYVPKFIGKGDKVTRSENTKDVGQTLMALINSYRQPDGINLENSLRIEKFYATLLDCSPQMNENDPKIKELEKSILELTSQERNEIFFDENKAKFDDIMKANLSPEMYYEINMLIAETT